MIEDMTPEQSDDLGKSDLERRVDALEAWRAEVDPMLTTPRMWVADPETQTPDSNWGLGVR